MPVPDVYSAGPVGIRVCLGGQTPRRSIRPDSPVSVHDRLYSAQIRTRGRRKPSPSMRHGRSGYLHELDSAGAAIVVTADHGMKPKHGPDGSSGTSSTCRMPWTEWLGTRPARRVILPITDPYVVHHGSLGSFATSLLAGGLRTMSGKVISAIWPRFPGNGRNSRSAVMKPPAGLNCPGTGSAIAVVISTAKARFWEHRRHRHQLDALDAPLEVAWRTVGTGRFPLS